MKHGNIEADLVSISANESSIRGVPGGAGAVNVGMLEELEASVERTTVNTDSNHVATLVSVSSNSIDGTGNGTALGIIGVGIGDNKAVTSGVADLTIVNRTGATLTLKKGQQVYRDYLNFSNGQIKSPYDDNLFIEESVTDVYIGVVVDGSGVSIANGGSETVKILLQLDRSTMKSPVEDEGITFDVYNSTEMTEALNYPVPKGVAGGRKTIIIRNYLGFNASVTADAVQGDITILGGHSVALGDLTKDASYSSVTIRIFGEVSAYGNSSNVTFTLDGVRVFTQRMGYSSTNATAITLLNSASFTYELGTSFIPASATQDYWDNTFKGSLDFVVSTYEELKIACATNTVGSKAVFIKSSLQIPAGDPLVVVGVVALQGAQIAIADGATLTGSDSRLDVYVDIGYMSTFNVIGLTVYCKNLGRPGTSPTTLDIVTDNGFHYERFNGATLVGTGANPDIYQQYWDNTTDEGYARTEKGEWTPELYYTATVADCTYDNRAGIYTRIGNMVFCSCTILLSSKGSGSGVVRIQDFPYSVTDDLDNTGIESGGVIPYAKNFTSLTRGLGLTVTSSGYAGLQNWDSTGTDDVTDANLTDTSTFRAVFSYTTDDDF